MLSSCITKYIHIIDTLHLNSEQTESSQVVTWSYVTSNGLFSVCSVWV